MKPKVPRGKPAIVDEAGVAWQAEADARYGAALEGADSAEAVVAAYEAPALPDFGAARPAHVTREVFGRFLHNRDDNVLHDVAAATEACAIDRIPNATFVHFAHELEPALPADVVHCANCLPGA